MMNRRTILTGAAVAGLASCARAGSSLPETGHTFVLVRGTWHGGWENMSGSFFHCVGQTFAKSSEKILGPARQPGREFIGLDIPRDGMVTGPELVAETFLRLASQ